MYSSELTYRYSKALVELAGEEQTQDKVLGDLACFAEAADNNPEWFKLFLSSMLPAEKKYSLLQEFVSRAGFVPLTEKFLQVLLSAQRMELIPDIYKEFRAVVLDREKKIAVKVLVTDRELWPELEAEVQEVVGVLTAREPEFTCVLAPEIVGGFQLIIGDRFYDCSVKKELLRMKERLLQGICCP